MFNVSMDLYAQIGPPLSESDPVPTGGVWEGFREIFEAIPLGDALASVPRFLGMPIWFGLLVVLVLAGTAWIVGRRFIAEAREKRKIQRLIRRGDSYEAAELYWVRGDLDKALPLFVESKAYLRAARVCELTGQMQSAGEYYERAEAFADAAEAYKKAGKADRAAKILHRLGLAVESAKLFEAAGQPGQASTVLEQSHQYEDAAEMAEKAGEFARAGSLYASEHMQRMRLARGVLRPDEWKELCNLAKKAASAFEKAGDWHQASDLYLKGEMYREAATLLATNGSIDAAAEALQKGGFFDEAAAIYERAGHAANAAKMRAQGFQKRGMNLEAAQEFMKAGEFGAAADLWVQLDDRQKAAECYRDAGQYAEAGQLYSTLEAHAEAAACFEKAGQPEAAARHFGKMGQVAKQAELLSKVGRHVEAGTLFLREGLLDRAIAVLQEAPPDSEGFREASALLGKVFLDKGMLGVAAKKFQESLEGVRIQQKNLDSFYHLAIIQERQGQLKDAAGLLEQILAVQYDYRDVASRLGNLQLEISKSPTLRPTDSTVIVDASLSGAATGTGSTALPKDRFELVEEIGRGGMGIVYRARDRILNRVVALKYLPANFAKNALAVKNFQREAQSTAALNHPGIVTVFDVGFDSRGNYIAMEYLEGVTVKEYIRKNRHISFEDFFILTRQMAEALGYAHGMKIIHRDIKTSNMMWCSNGQGKLMDFGLAKIALEAQNAVTQISGTPYYMSPEQTLGKDLDHRTDIYSFGVSMFEMATGVVPFKEGDIGYHQIHTPTPDLTPLRPGLPTGLREVVWKCMEKNPEYRYSGAGQLVADLVKIHAQWRESSKRT